MKHTWPSQRGRFGLKSPFGSLPSRLSFFVFGATLLTSLVVTWISVNSIETFLRAKIDQKFPSVLSQTADRLELWYDQRELDIGVFASSRILSENVPSMSGRERADAGAEVEQYLRYVLESFPQYEALFVVDENAEILLKVGSNTQLPDGLRTQAAQSLGPVISALEISDGRRLQVAAAGVTASDGRRVGALAALLRLDALDAILSNDGLSPLGEIFLVRSDGSRISGPEDAPGAYASLRAEAGADPMVRDYETSSGARVVGSSLHLPRFGWSLVVEEPYDEAFAPVVSVISRILTINLAIVLLFGLGALQVANSIVRPIEALSAGARRLSEGERDVEIPETGTLDEIGLLTRAFNEMTGRLRLNTAELEESRREVEDANERLREQNDELQQVNEVLEQLSITDGLTRLHNHRYFQDFLSREARRADRTSEPLALVLVDIDHFKLWNDRIGHAGGDEILRRVAEVMNDVIRETDLLARYGGEEFALVAPHTDLEGAVLLAEKIRQSVSETDFVLSPPTEDDLKLTVSVGVALYQGDRQRLFEEADRALYRAKDAGRDCVVVGSETSSA